MMPIRFRSLLAALLAAFAAHAAAGTPVASDPEWTLESADAGGLGLTWTDARTGPGRERVLTVAIPPGQAATAALEGATDGSVSISAPARYRDLSICAVTLKPGRAASARVRVAFRPQASAFAWRPAFAPPETSPGERHLRSWIANYSQARGFRSAPAKALAKGSADGPSATALLPARRLVIRTLDEQIQVLDYDTLKAAGLPLGDIDPRRMRLFHDGREVAMHVSGEQDGNWDRGDYIEFIGKRAAGTTSYNSFYANRATFILVWDGGRLGLRAPAVPVASRTGGLVPSFPADAKLAPPYSARAHLELDVDVLRIGSTSAEEVIDLGSRVQETELTDFWMWKRLGAEKDQAELQFTLDHTPASLSAGDKAGSSGPLRMAVNLKGITNNPNASPDHHLKFLLNGSDISLVEGVTHDAIWEGQESYTWVSPPLNPSLLKPGKNVLVIQKVNDLKTSDGQIVEVQDAYLNFIQLEFPAVYKAVGDRIAFSNSFPDSAGLKLFTLSGFGNDALTLWDRQGRKLTNFRITRNGESWEASFLDTLAGRTDYLASTLDKRARPEIRLDTLPDLLDKSKGADYLVITEEGLLGRGLDSLIAFRAKQGLRTRVALTRHIYQAFGDGSMDPAALRRFVAYAYANWERPAPLYLVLVGDATVGFEKTGGTRVPFHPVNIRGWGVAANDDYFAKVSGDDDIADLHVGRIPAADKAQLSAIVRKTILAETTRPQGHWSNKALLIGGFESSFTAQNGVLQGLAVAADRQYSRLDLFPGSPYYKTAAQRANFFAQMDSGFNLVSFVGHGGGAVWSDAGVLTLKALDEGRLQGEFPVSLISSITCLTGFFEDVTAPSLGEEMIRLAKGGAAGFYGAAGYISNLAGEALSAEVVRAAAGNAFPSNGAIITQAETMVKLRTGDVFLPILAEFNLLGDPAFGLPFPEREGTLTLSPDVLAGTATLQARGSKFAIAGGSAKATVFLGDSIESESEATVASNGMETKRTFPSALPQTQNGKVIAHYWNDKEARVVSAPFSSLDWLIDSVTLEPAAAAPGDSVRIRMRLNTAYARTRFNGGIVSWAVGSDLAPQFGERQIGLVAVDGSHLESAAKVRLEVPDLDLAGPKVHVSFTLSVQILDDQDEVVRQIQGMRSRNYALPLSELPRVELPARALHLPVQDELGVWVMVHNRGMGAAKDLRVTLARDAEGPFPIVDTVAYPKSLGLGALDSVFFALSDSMVLGKRLRATLIPGREGDLAETGRSQDTVFNLRTARLASRTDTLRLDTAGGFVSLADANSRARRAFASAVQVPALPSHLAPALGALPVTAYRIEATDFGTAGFSIGRIDPALPKAAARALSPAWHYRALDGQTWVKLDSLDSAPGSRVAAGFRSGLYALLLNKDATPPMIQLSSRGQALLADDYVPTNTSIDIVLRDGEGMDLALHPPRLVSRRQTLDTTNTRIEAGDLFPTLARMDFIPARRAVEDSITITARDISGNTATRTLAYRMGDKLSIRELGSYPNPFADTAIFVYSLTDYCDKVDLKIYSRAGRPVRGLAQRNVVGYQEMIWDGRTDAGKEVANGLYFLKVTAKAGTKETSRIFKLIKKKRK